MDRDKPVISPPQASVSPRPGRPRRGTGEERTEALIAAATRVFLREGYGLASIDKVAAEAGASTRTIYERFKNKADLLAGVIARLVDLDFASEVHSESLKELEPRAALTHIGRTLLQRLAEPGPAALYRIVATEAQRFPELVEKMRSCALFPVERSIAAYLAAQAERGTLAVTDPSRTATLFLHMLTCALRDHVLFDDAQALAAFDRTAHVEAVVELFLAGALPRAGRSHIGTPT